MICHKDTRARRQHEVSLCFLGALVSLWRAFPLVTIHSLVCTYDMPAGPLPTVIVRATSSVFRSMTDKVFAPLLEMNAHRPSAERLMATPTPAMQKRNAQTGQRVPDADR